MTPALLSWSGGKDAAWTLHAARMRGELAIVGLLTTFTEGHDRVSMQGIRRDVLHAQARAAGLPLVEAWIPQAATNVIYEAAFGDALAEELEVGHVSGRGKRQDGDRVLDGGAGRTPPRHRCRHPGVEQQRAQRHGHVVGAAEPSSG